MSEPIVTCGECGIGLPAAEAHSQERAPCARCGGRTIHVSIAVFDSARATDSATWEAQTTNAAETRYRQLRSALIAVETGVNASNISAVQDALKRALEPVHELADCLKRREWSQAGWTADEIGLWVAHIGARNAAHHTSSQLLVLRSHGLHDDRLIWAIKPQAIGSLRSQLQAHEYRARLDGQSVLRPLRALVDAVSRSIN